MWFKLLARGLVIVAVLPDLELSSSGFEHPLLLVLATVGFFGLLGVDVEVFLVSLVGG